MVHLRIELNINTSKSVESPEFPKILDKSFKGLRTYKQINRQTNRDNNTIYLVVLNWIRICLIYLESMKRAMVEFEIDLTKMPLGKLSKAHVQKERVTFIIHLLTFFYLKVTIFSNLLCWLILKLYLYISSSDGHWAITCFLELLRFSFTLKGTKHILWTFEVKNFKTVFRKCVLN